VEWGEPETKGRRGTKHQNRASFNRSPLPPPFFFSLLLCHDGSIRQRLSGPLLRKPFLLNGVVYPILKLCAEVKLV